MKLEDILNDDDCLIERIRYEAYDDGYRKVGTIKENVRDWVIERVGPFNAAYQIFVLRKKRAIVELKEFDRLMIGMCELANRKGMSRPTSAASGTTDSSSRTFGGNLRQGQGRVKINNGGKAEAVSEVKTSAAVTLPSLSADGPSRDKLIAIRESMSAEMYAKHEAVARAMLAEGNSPEAVIKVVARLVDKPAEGPKSGSECEEPEVASPGPVDLADEAAKVVAQISQLAPAAMRRTALARVGAKADGDIEGVINVVEQTIGRATRANFLVAAGRGYATAYMEGGGRSRLMCFLWTQADIAWGLEGPVEALKLWMLMLFMTLALQGVILQLAWLLITTLGGAIISVCGSVAGIYMQWKKFTGEMTAGNTVASVVSAAGAVGAMANNVAKIVEVTRTASGGPGPEPAGQDTPNPQ